MPASSGAAARSWPGADRRGGRHARAARARRRLRPGRAHVRAGPAAARRLGLPSAGPHRDGRLACLPAAPQALRARRAGHRDVWASATAAPTPSPHVRDRAFGPPAPTPAAQRSALSAAVRPGPVASVCAISSTRGSPHQQAQPRLGRSHRSADARAVSSAEWSPPTDSRASSPPASRRNARVRTVTIAVMPGGYPPRTRENRRRSGRGGYALAQ
jgi:hypothetical protein